MAEDRSMRYTAEVEDALRRGGAVVALESTIIAHGFPYPDNLALAEEMEAAVRGAGAVPATIAVIGGRFCIGLAERERQYLAAGEGIAKCSTRDLGVVSARGGDGATTVAATSRLAWMAGINVFATGGIGGVHPPVPGAPPDVSADLLELSRTPVTVVCSGAKSILDLPATLEVLESLGVPVIGYRTDRFPAFHAVDSGLDVPHRADSVTALAEIVHRHRALTLPGGVLVANPPPADLAIDRMGMEAMVAAALDEAADRGIAGPALTPFLLAALDRISDGRTGRVNRGLALANAKLAAEIAVAQTELS